MGKLDGKVAVVTGASKGIGAGIARRLAAEGASVVVNYASSKEGADRVVAEIEGKVGSAVAIQGDVAKAGEVKRLFALTKEAFGRLDVLVNNAGVFEFAPLEAITEEHFHRQFNINVLGLILASQEAAGASSTSARWSATPRPPAPRSTAARRGRSTPSRPRSPGSWRRGRSASIR